MKQPFRKWLDSILMWLFRKIYPVERMAKALSFLSTREVISVGYAAMQPVFEKENDEKLEKMIKDIKGNFPIEFAAYLAQLEKAGLTRDIILQWLESEKFLREHRRKYHPEEGLKT